MRYKWVDVYRGIAVLLMLILHFFVNIFPSQPIWFLDYSKRGVIAFGDMDIAMFLFISGVSTYLSIAGRKNRNDAVKHAFSRYSKIFLLGLLLDVILIIITGYVWWVLEAIGLSGIIALCFICFPNRMKLLAILIIGVCYSYLVSFPSISLPVSSLPNGGPIGSLSLSAVVLFGYMSGEVMKKLSSLAKSGVVLMLLGFLLANFIIYDRNVATLPFILLSSGFCMLLMVFVYWLVELKGISLNLLQDFGKSALLIFVLNYPVLILAVTFGVYQAMSIAEAAFVSILLIMLFAAVLKCRFILL